MTRASENPYEPPTAASESSTAIPHRAVYRYTELPRSCPSCERKFSDALYHRIYRRRFRWSTLAFFVLLAVFGFALMQFIGWLALFIVIPSGTWAMPCDACALLAASRAGCGCLSCTQSWGLSPACSCGWRSVRRRAGVPEHCEQRPIPRPPRQESAAAKTRRLTVEAWNAAHASSRSH